MVAGKWELKVAAPVGEITAVIELAEENGAWKGRSEDSEGQSEELSAIKVDGNNVKFKMQSKTPFGKTTMKADLTVDGDDIAGTISFLMGKLKAQGKRI